ncbi:MAG: CBS domain-containing protein [Verrucomicrobia bacterium]|nr:CBS domain-containing protein [Verrucomicrobiota bacterium]
MITATIDNLLGNKAGQIWSVPPDATVLDALKLMAAKNVGALLVMQGDQLVGILSERDYARKVTLKGRAADTTRVSEVITTPVVTVTPQQTVEECMRLMTSHRFRHLPVVKDGKVLGVISIGDLINWTISAQEQAIQQMENYIAGGYR